jgi:hypothetical protein
MDYWNSFERHHLLLEAAVQRRRQGRVRLQSMRRVGLAGSDLRLQSAEQDYSAHLALSTNYPDSELLGLLEGARCSVVEPCLRARPISTKCLVRLCSVADGLGDLLVGFLEVW